VKENNLIRVFIDNNVWDIFYKYNLDLCTELPASKYALLITREAEFEFEGMPSEKKTYVNEQILKRKVKTDRIFGFYNPAYPPNEQRFGGFGTYSDNNVGGRFIRDDEAKILKEERKAIGKKKKSGLYNNEADVAIASRSLHSVVLTCDNKKVLKRAKKRTGSLILNLSNYDNTISISELIDNIIKGDKS
jgi:hypothetical protein